MPAECFAPLDFRNPWHGMHNRDLRAIVREARAARTDQAKVLERCRRLSEGGE